MLAYFLFHPNSAPAAIVWIINIFIYIIIAMIVWLLIQWAAKEFGVDPRIVKLVGLLMFLCLILTLFVGCASYQKSVDSRSVGVAGQVTPEGGGGKVIYTVHYK